MANFDDPTFFEDAIFNFDPNHLAPPFASTSSINGQGPSQTYLGQHRHSISSTTGSEIFSIHSHSPSSASAMGFDAPPSLQLTGSTRSSASPRSSNGYLSTFSESELDDLLNFGNGDDVFTQQLQLQQVNGYGQLGMGMQMGGMTDHKPTPQHLLQSYQQPQQQQFQVQQQQQHQHEQQQQQQQQPFYLPNFTFGQEQTQNQNRQQQSFDFGKVQTDQLANMLLQQSLQQQQQQQHQQQSQGQTFQQSETMAPEWLQTQLEVLKQQTQYNQPSQTSFSEQPQSASVQQLPTVAPVVAPSSTSITSAATASRAKTTVARVPGRRGPKPKDGPSASAPGGKHNKTERRYRQKVQAAQSDLRDAVPALRVLYGTSTEEQRATTDIKAPDGSVDGLGEITRPNASAKTTIFVGARMYIELLQHRVASLDRKVSELENYRSAVGGQEDLDSWKSDFDQREKELKEVIDAEAKLKREQESDEDGEEGDSVEVEAEVDDEDDEPSPPPSKKRKGRKPNTNSKTKLETTSDSDIKSTSASTAVRVFAAFAMTFSFLPSAGETFTSIPSTSTVIEPLSNPSAGQVISRIPIITAEHTSRLLARSLPSSVVPHPSTLVEWGWKVMVALLIAVALGPLYRRFSRTSQPSLLATIKEGIKFTLRIESPLNPSVVANAAGIVGGAIIPTTTTRWFTILHLNRTASDSYSLAILALLQPEYQALNTPDKLWREARASINETTPAALITVLELPLSEAIHYLALVGPTQNPIEGMADQITLVHLNDLYSRIFTKLVQASTDPKHAVPTTVRALLNNLTTYDIGSELKASGFDRELRGTIAGVSKGTPSHALGLVLIGLWGVFTGPAPESQATLATALAVEEIQTQAGAGLTSVSAMLNLLYPGSSTKSTNGNRDGNNSYSNSNANANAMALDRLALVCIEYLKLLMSAANPPKTTIERIEASKKIGVITTNLRLALAYTDLKITPSISPVSDGRDKGSDALMESESGVDSGEEMGLGMQSAKERLVAVLSAVGRRAMGRVDGRDEDSGLEAEIDEL